MLKRINECSYTQLYTYMINNLRKIITGEVKFSYAILMFLNNPNLKDMVPKERRRALRKIMSELKLEVAEQYIEVGEDDEL